MALQKQKISIPFLSTLDTKSDSKQLQPGSLITAENVTFDSPNQLKKRNGFIAASNSTSWLDMATTDTGVSLFDGTQLFPYVQPTTTGRAAGQLDTSMVTTHQITARQVTPGIGSSLHPIYGSVRVNGLDVTLYTISGSDLWFTVTDSVTGTVINISQFIGTNCIFGQIAAAGNTVYIAYNNSSDNHLKLFSFTATSITTPISLGNIDAATLTQAQFGLVSDGTTLAYAYITGTSAIRVAKYVPGTGITHPGSVAATNNSLIRDVNLDYTGTYMTVTVWDSTNTNINILPYLFSTMAAVFSVVTVATGVSPVPNFASTTWDNSYFVTAYTQGTVDSTTGTLPVSVVTTLTTISGASGAAGVTFHNASLAGGLCFIAPYTRVPLRVLSELQPTILFKSYNAPTGAYHNSFTLAPSSSAFYSSTTFNLVSPFIIGGSSLLFPTLNVTSNNGLAPDSNIFSNHIILDSNSSDNFSSAQLNGATHIANGLQRYFDGISVAETGFLFFPENLSVASTSTSGGSLTDGTYAIQACYVWNDALGYLHRSAPSPVLSMTLSGGGSTQSAIILVPNLYHSDKVSTFLDGVYIELYRTTNSGTVFHLEQYKAQDLSFTTGPETAFTTTGSDATLNASEVLYTTGGVLENIVPFASNLIESYKDRIFTVIGNNTIQYSKLRSSTEPIAFNDTNILTVNEAGGPISQIKIMDDKIIIFKKYSAIFYITGNGPNNLGQQNDFSDAELIASDVGCYNPDSCVITPQGVFFQSTKGICLLDRSLQISYIGAPVEAFNNLTITSANVINNKNLVIFATLQGTWLTYNYYVNKWATYPNLPAFDTEVFNGVLYYLSTAKQLFTQSTLFADLNSNSPIPINIETGWISFGSVQGFQRLYHILLLMSYKSPHSITIQVAYDYVDTYIDTVTVASSSTFISGFPYELRINVQNQKCRAIKLKILDIPTTNGESFSLSNLMFSVGIKNADAAKGLPSTSTVAPTH